jgi:hypothetical protein
MLSACVNWKKFASNKHLVLAVGAFNRPSRKILVKSPGLSRRKQACHATVIGFAGVLSFKDERMVDPVPTPACNLGFLSLFHDVAGYFGGYLVTNAWGRPLEFRVSSLVQPNKIQQALYGTTLDQFLCGEVIGKTLVEKSTTATRLVTTDNPLALDLRHGIETPVALWAGTDAATPAGWRVQPQVFCHDRFREDAAIIRKLLEQLGPFDLGEPFQRIREAMQEARKFGVMSRAG